MRLPDFGDPVKKLLCSAQPTKITIHFVNPSTSLPLTRVARSGHAGQALFRTSFTDLASEMLTGHSQMTMSFIAFKAVKGWESSHSQMTTSFRVVSSDRIVILIPQLMPTDTKQRRITIHFAPWAQAHCVRSMAAKLQKKSNMSRI